MAPPQSTAVEVQPSDSRRRGKLPAVLPPLFSHSDTLNDDQPGALAANHRRGPVVFEAMWDHRALRRVHWLRCPASRKLQGNLRCMTLDIAQKAS